MLEQMSKPVELMAKALQENPEVEVFLLRTAVTTDSEVWQDLRYMSRTFLQDSYLQIVDYETRAMTKDLERQGCLNTDRQVWTVEPVSFEETS